MAMPPVLSPTNRLVPVILILVLIGLILIGAWFYLHHQGKSPSNPTEGHTSLIVPGTSA